MPKEFHYDVVQHFETITTNEASTGTKYTKELNLVSYNDADPVYDIRNWTHMANGEDRIGKGITLSFDEIRRLRDILNGMDELRDE